MVKNKKMIIYYIILLYNAVNNIQNLYNQHKSKKYIIENINNNDELMKSSVVQGMKYFTDTIFNNRILYDKIHKELFNKFELLSYNNQNLIKNTQNGSNEIDKYIRELKILLNEIELYKIPDYEIKIKKLKNKNQIINLLLDKKKDITINNIQ